MEGEEATRKLTELLKLEDTERALIIAYSAMGRMMLMLHWMRGMITWMHHTGAVQYKNEEQLNNYKELDQLLDRFETTAWEVLPPRALLPIIREWRKTGVLDDDVIGCMPRDTHGSPLDKPFVEKFMSRLVSHRESN